MVAFNNMGQPAASSVHLESSLLRDHLNAMSVAQALSGTIGPLPTFVACARQSHSSRRRDHPHASYVVLSLLAVLLRGALPVSRSAFVHLVRIGFHRLQLSRLVFLALQVFFVQEEMGHHSKRLGIMAPFCRM